MSEIIIIDLTSDEFKGLVAEQIAEKLKDVDIAIVSAGIANLLSANEVLALKNTELTEELELSLEINKDLQAQFDELEKSPPKIVKVAGNGYKDASFEFEGETFKFKLPKMFIGQKAVLYTDVLVSKDLQAELVKKKSGMIAPRSGQWPQLTEVQK